MNHSPVRILFLSTALLLLLQANAFAQGNFVYANNNPFSGPNTVSAFSVAADGTLTEIPGSPFATGGTGGATAPGANNRSTAHTMNQFLFVANGGSSDVSVFSINAVTGALTLVPGSPFAIGGSGVSDISIAVTPDGRFLMASNSDTNSIAVLSIASNGALAPIAGSPFAVGTPVGGIKISPDGRFLSLALPLVDEVDMFNIASNGVLTPVPGSPFPGSGKVVGIDINCASNLLFASDAITTTGVVNAFNIGADGALTPVPGSPFTLTGNNSTVPILSTNDGFLFVSNPGSNEITVLSVAADGSLTPVPGSPFPNTGGHRLIYHMATNQAGTLLYVANYDPDTDNVVTVFSIASNGALTPVPGSPFTNTTRSGVRSLVAFPGKSCAPVNTAPVATSDGYNLAEDTALNVSAPGVLANDSDAEGNPLTAGLVSGPSHGTLTLNADGSFSYTPNADYNGPDNFTYKANDGSDDSNLATVAITVTPVNDSPVGSAGGPYVVMEGGSVTVVASATDVDGDALTFAWDLDGNGSFETPGASATFSAAGLDGPSSRVVKVRISDGTVAVVVQAVLNILNVPPVLGNLSLGATTINESDAVALSGAFSDPGTPDTHQVVINWGDGSPNSVVNLSAGVLTFHASHQYLDDSPTATASDSYTINVSVVDDDGGSGGGTTSITVNNLAPVISTVSGPTAPMAIGNAASITVNYADAGSLDTHTVTYSWDDGSPNTTRTAQGTGNGSDTATHTYAGAGVYTVAVTVRDDDTGVTTSSFQFVVVYDSNAGFVTGGGWINSLAGSYAGDPNASGRANFGFVSKYQRGATVPTGDTEFQFQAGNFTFESTVYEWLVISGARAQYKGSGKVNGAGAYGFLLTATDGQQNGGGGTDKFRIKVWDKATGQVVYDNKRGSPDDIDSANPQELGGGSIVIHR